VILVLLSNPYKEIVSPATDFNSTFPFRGLKNESSAMRNRFILGKNLSTIPRLQKV
jgi:hypothetical protein